MKELRPSYDAAVAYVLASHDTTCSGLQRTLRIGYGQAMRLQDQMEKAGIYAGMERHVEPAATRIVVVGVGGAGCNALEEVVSTMPDCVGTLAINMDKQSLGRSKAENVVHIVPSSQVSRVSVQAAYQLASQHHRQISDALGGAHIVFIAAGLGGTTGTGTAPLVAEIAREIGAFTIGVVFNPLPVEGEERHRTARDGLQKLSSVTDVVFVLPQPGLDGHNGSTTMVDVMRGQDRLLCELVEGVAQAIDTKGGIALSLFDLKALLRKTGSAMWGRGAAVGEGRAILAVERACQDLMAKGLNVQTAKGAVLVLRISRKVTGREIKRAITALKSKFATGTDIGLSIRYDDRSHDGVEVLVIVTGLPG